MFLTQQEIFELTGKKRHDAQARALNKLGIIFKIRADGVVIVLEAHVNKVMGGETKGKTLNRIEPNFEGINA